MEVHRPHRALTITAAFLVETGGGHVPAAAGGLPAEYLLPSELTRPDGRAAADLARLAGGDPLALMRAVHDRMAYRPGVTGTDGREPGARGRGAGVPGLCPCLCGRGTPAWLASALRWWLRASGWPDAPRAAHAWVEVLDGNGWVGLDPTNDCAADERFPRLTCGRDCADVPPVRGVFAGVAPDAPRVRLEVAAEAAGDR